VNDNRGLAGSRLWPQNYVSLRTDEVMNPRCRTVKEEFRKNSAVCERVVTLLHLISNKTRFRIVCLLSRGEFCVNDIMGVVNEGNFHTFPSSSGSCGLLGSCRSAAATSSSFTPSRTSAFAG
jgi:hypothetical protein